MSEPSFRKRSCTFTTRSVLSIRWYIPNLVELTCLSFGMSQGVIHRDIKAENFLYRTKESAIDDFVLIDFGIAKVSVDTSVVPRV